MKTSTSIFIIMGILTVGVAHFTSAGIKQAVNHFSQCGIKVCTWTEWSKWGECTTTCGGGSRKRQRQLCGWFFHTTVKRLKYCGYKTSDAVDTEECNNLCQYGVWNMWDRRCDCHLGHSGICCTVITAKWNIWSPWSTCSQSCTLKKGYSSGQRSRMRKCIDPLYPKNSLDIPKAARCVGSSRQTKVCNNSMTVCNTTKREFDNLKLNQRPGKKTPVLIGERVLLQCSSNHDVPIIWYKGRVPLRWGRNPGDIVTGRGGSLLIRFMKKKHIGNYTCVAQKHNKIVTAVTKLLLSDTACDIAFTSREPGVLYIKVGADLALRCATTERAQLVWWLKQTGISVVEVQKKTAMQNELRLHAVALNNTGEYTCTATNTETGCSILSRHVVTVYEKPESICGKVIIQPWNLNQSRGHIVGGQNAERGSAPWHAMLWERSVKVFCSAVIINAQYLLSAAHCVREFYRIHRIPFDIRNVVVKVGKLRRNDDFEATFEHHFRVREIIMHKNFNPLTYDSDIILIKLRAKIKFNDYIKPVCLPTSKEKITGHGSKPDRLQFGIITGWGALVEKGPYPEMLQELRLPIQSRDICQNSTKYLVTNNMFCAGYGKEVMGDSCRGDSGGPFVVKDKLDRWTLVGLISWGEYGRCAREGKYGFYTKVKNFMPWITEHTAQ